MRYFLLSRYNQRQQHQLQQPSNLLPHKNARQQPQQKAKVVAPEDETFIFERCSCNACATLSLSQDSERQLHQFTASSSSSLCYLDDNFESFSTAIISASTVVDIVKISETWSSQKPVEQNKVDAVIGATSTSRPCNNKTSAVTFTSVALGQLQRKESPLFGRKSTSCQKSYSLRSEQPLYGQSKVAQQQQDLVLTDHKRTVKRKFKENREQSVAKAIKMNLNAATNGQGNGAKTLNNGIDINRNKDFLLNGPIMTSSAEKREHLYKILVIGELGTGKTSFIKRYVHQFFSQNYRATIGVDFALKVLHWDANTIVRLQLWDIAGQERFGNMTRVYYKEAVGAFIVFDVTRSGTFDCVSKWKEDLDSKVQLPDGSPIPCILLANKCDQDKQGIVTTPEKMDEYVKENGFAGWFETSAKENINIDEAARALVNKILLNDKLISAADLADSEKFNLNSSAEETVSESKSKCSC